MAYATTADVTARGGEALANLSATSKPTAVQVDGFLDDKAGEIDAYLAGHGIPVPATGTTAKALKDANAWGATLMALMARYPGAKGPADLKEEARKAWDKACTMLETGKHPAVKAGLEALEDSSSGEPGSFWTDDGSDPRYLPDPYDGTVHNPNTEPTIVRGMPL